MKRLATILALMLGPGSAQPDVQFNGTSDSGSSALVSTSVQNMSVAVIFYAATQAENGILFYNGDSSLNGWGVTVSDGVCGAGAKVNIQVGGLSCNATASSATITLNAWHHAVVTRTTTTWSLYVDGVSYGNTTSFTPTTPTGSTWVGGRGGVDNFSGIIADVQYYDRALSATEVGLLATPYQRKKFAANGDPIRYWTLTEAPDGASANAIQMREWRQSGQHLTMSGGTGRAATRINHP